jgi:hypothetical protein
MSGVHTIVFYEECLLLLDVLANASMPVESRTLILTVSMTSISFPTLSDGFC